MSDVKWIKINTLILDDSKMKLIDSMPERDAIFRIWIGILGLCGQCNAQGMIYLSENMPYTDEMLATLFNRPLNIVRLALNTLTKFGMIEVFENGVIFISNWEKHQNLDKLEKIKEQSKLRMQKHRSKAKEIGSNVTVTQHYATDKNRVDKNRVDKNRVDKNRVDKNRVDKTIKTYTDDFEYLWSKYPRKKDKKACYLKYNATLKKGLTQGFTHKELLTATINYAKTVVGKEFDFIKHGATFFGPTHPWTEFLTEQKESGKYEGSEEYVKRFKDGL